MRIVAVPGLCWLLVLTIAIIPVNHGIQVMPKGTATNATADFKPTTNQRAETNATIVGDSELSASERNRRLIPYMAFYLPPVEYPVNQQYAVQRSKLQQQQQHQQAVESAGPLPPPGHIPVPTAYVRMKVPAADTELQYQSQPPYQPVAGDIYHSISYGGQHPLPAGLNELSGKPQPILHLLPPGAPGSLRPAGAVALGSAGPLITTYKDINAPVKHKTVQHFPPLPTREQAPQSLSLQQTQHQQQQQLQQQQAYRQRPKQSKINLTPFMPSNSLPGHFVPIIYTPVHSNDNNNNNNNNDDSDNNNDYDSPTVAAAAKATALQATSEEQPTQQQYRNSQHKQQLQLQLEQEQQQQQQIAAEYALPAPRQHHHQQQHQQQQQQQQPLPQVQFIAVTGPPTGTDIASSPIYHVISDASSPLSPAPQQQQPTLIAFKQSPQPQFRHKHPHFHAPKPENFFDSEQRQHYELQQQQHYLHADNMTPQEKYVLFLQQRIRYNKHQLQQQKQRERTKEREQYLKQQQQQQQQPQPHIFVIGSTAAPVATLRPIELPQQYYQQPQQQLPQQQQHHHHQRPMQEQPQYNYPQHSPIGHAAYTRPELPVPANHQTQTKPVQQLLHIPLPPPTAVVSDLDTLQQQYQSGNSQQQLSKQNYPKSGSPSKSQYIDYSIDEPKQSLDDEQHNAQRPQTGLKPTIAPPQAAYIVITASPPTESTHNEHYGSTMRPMYKQQPTLRLRPVPQNEHYNYPTSRPTPKPAVGITPQYVYVSTKPSYDQVLISPTPKTKLQPAYKYESRIKPTQAAHVEYGAKQVPPHQLQEKPIHYEPQAKVLKPNLQPLTPVDEPNQLPDIRTASLAEILRKLQASNHLPQTLTPDNIDNSIKTLITILNNLKETQTIVANPPQHHETPPASADYDYGTGGGGGGSTEDTAGQDLSALAPVKPNKHPGPSTGRPGIDYPNYADIPQTAFDCAEQRYKGFFGDPETNCQVWHYCDLNGGKASFLCPNGTIFSQIALTCDWWFNVKCSATAQLYVLNERLYKYILPFTPKFPEDYSGPLVDKYLAMKFQEMEEKMRQVTEKAQAAAAVEAAKQDAAQQQPEETTTTDSASPTTKSHESVNSQVSEQSSERNLLIDDEVDDIAQRGSYDTYGTSTPPPGTTSAAELSLSLRPIVVSSTVEPDYYVEDQSKSEEEQPTERVDQVEPKKLVTHADYEAQTSVPKMTRERTKISVEKVEVIEIKTDGSTGHLTPEMIFNNAVKKK